MADVGQTTGSNGGAGGNGMADTAMVDAVSLYPPTLPSTRILTL